jgi:hypothetical protein
VSNADVGARAALHNEQPLKLFLFFRLLSVSLIVFTFFLFYKQQTPRSKGGS